MSPADWDLFFKLLEKILALADYHYELEREAKLRGKWGSVEELLEPD